MKKPLLLLLIPVLSLAQFTSPLTIQSVIAAKNNVAITNRTFAASTCDTAYAQDIRKATIKTKPY